MEAYHLRTDHHDQVGDEMHNLDSIFIPERHILVGLELYPESGLAGIIRNYSGNKSYLRRAESISKRKPHPEFNQLVAALDLDEAFADKIKTYPHLSQVKLLKDYDKSTTSLIRILIGEESRAYSNSRSERLKSWLFSGARK